MFRFYTVHPFFVHFVIALFTVSVLLDGLGIWRRNERLNYAAWLNLLASAVSVLLAVASGLWSKTNSGIPESARSALEIHETAAFLVSGIILALVLWRIGLKGRFPRTCRKIYMTVAVVGVLLMLAGAWYGGKLVYLHGVGVQRVRPETTKQEQQKPQKPRFSPEEDFAPAK